MPDERKIPPPPKGISRFLFRLPIIIYRIGLGWIMGQRFILVNHIGRKSGKKRQAVLEVIKADPEERTYYVVSAYGERSQWFRNLMHTPQVEVQVGGRRFGAYAERVPAEEGAELLAAYADEHPTAAREISRMVGYEGEGTVENFRALGKSLPVVKFSPR